MTDHNDHKRPAMNRQEAQRMRAELRDEESEATLLSNIEKRAAGNAAHGDGFQPAVFGERAPLGEAALDVAFGSRTESAPASMQGKGKMDFKTMAQRVLSSQRSAKSKSKRDTSNDNNGHRRVATLLASIDESNRDMNELNKLRNNGSIDIGDWGDLINQDVHEHIDEEQRRPQSSTSIDDLVQPPPHYPVSESLPLLNATERYDGGSPRTTARRRAAAGRAKQFWKNFRDCMNPIQWVRRIIYLFFHSFIVLALPCFAVSWVLYYHLRNPKFDFMPGQATLSWWLNFFGA